MAQRNCHLKIQLKICNGSDETFARRELRTETMRIHFAMHLQVKFQIYVFSCSILSKNF